MIEARAKNNIGRNRIPSLGEMYFVPVVDGKEYSHAGETEEVALLLGLQIKYDGLNSQFTKNACRMLQIDSQWAE